jgi:hypothetical protein
MRARNHVTRDARRQAAAGGTPALNLPFSSFPFRSVPVRVGPMSGPATNPRLLPLQVLIGTDQEASLVPDQRGKNRS